MQDRRDAVHRHIQSLIETRRALEFEIQEARQTIEQEGLVTALVDLDPQGSASTWASLRIADTPAVISGHAAQLPTLLTAARDAGAKFAIIDTAPHSTDAALAAAHAADLVLIPCRASVADLYAIGTSIEITRQAGTAATVVLNAAPVQGPLVKQARDAIAAYEVEMIPVVLHHRIAHVHAFTAPELTQVSKAGVYRSFCNLRKVS